jgi:hypothetical protein
MNFLGRRVRISRRFVIVGLALLIIYIGSYVALSIGGCYEPYCIGLGGVKCYAWAPHGFVTDYKWNTMLMIVYHPLMVLDERYWHTYDYQFSGKYPINEVDKKDIWRVYQAWGALKTTEQSPTSDVDKSQE